MNQDTTSITLHDQTGHQIAIQENNKNHTKSFFPTSHLEIYEPTFTFVVNTELTFVKIYLEQLNSNNCKHKLKKAGNQHDVADGLNSHYDALNYMLKFQRSKPVPKRHRQGMGEKNTGKKLIKKKN